MKLTLNEKNENLNLYLENKEEAIKKFFEELKTIDAESYLEIPLSKEEWEKCQDQVIKMATVVLFTGWLHNKIIPVWEGWFYKTGKFLIMIEPIGKDSCTVAIINKENGKIFVETYTIPQTLKPLFWIDTEGIFET